MAKKTISISTSESEVAFTFAKKIACESQTMMSLIVDCGIPIGGLRFPSPRVALHALLERATIL